VIDALEPVSFVIDDEGVEVVRFPSQSRWGTQRTAKPAWRKLRLQVLKRDGAICRYCGRPGAETVDHVIGVANGGTDDMSNLVAACWPCHRTKTGREARAKQQPRKRPQPRHPGIVA
jgi:5-methylcytosine-specific restriction endonuclease McrA